jgi:tetratricopeptide (TPR) repeat protein
LAKIYQRQGRLGDAEAILLNLLQLEPNSLQARTELAKIYQRQGGFDEAEGVLLKSLEIDPQQLHSRIELAKVYQRQGRLDEAEKRAEEVLTIDPLNDHAMSELLAIWERQGEKDKCTQRFLTFIDQPGYRFSRISQASVFRFFRCCRTFGMKEHADTVFERFKSQLDDRNLEFYKRFFR